MRATDGSEEGQLVDIGLICGRDESEGWVRGGIAGGYRAKDGSEG